jgi:hypothetical protein
MITAQYLRDMDLATFSLIYAHSIINIEAEKVLALILEENYLRNSKTLRYTVSLDHIYHFSLVEAIKLKIQLTSIYLKDGTLVIDWSE